MWMTLNMIVACFNYDSIQNGDATKMDDFPPDDMMMMGMPPTSMPSKLKSGKAADKAAAAAADKTPMGPGKRKTSNDIVQNYLDTLDPEPLTDDEMAGRPPRLPPKTFPHQLEPIYQNVPQQDPWGQQQGYRRGPMDPYDDVDMYYNQRHMQAPMQPQQVT